MTLRPGLKAELAHLVLEVANTDGTYVWDELVNALIIDSAESIDDLWVMEAAAERLVAAGKEVLAEIRRRMATDVAEFGAVRLGTTLYRVAPPRERKIIEGQEEALLDWLGPDLKHAVNANTVRIGSVRAIAKKRSQDPVTVEETFYYVDTDGDPALLRLPEIKAPKYFATMSHGDRR